MVQDTLLLRLTGNQTTTIFTIDDFGNATIVVQNLLCHLPLTAIRCDISNHEAHF